MRMRDQCCSAVGKKDTTGTPIMFKPLPSHSISLFWGNGMSVYEIERKRDWGPRKAESLEMIHIQRLPGNRPFLPSHQAGRRRVEEEDEEKKREMDSLPQRL